MKATLAASRPRHRAACGCFAASSWRRGVSRGGCFVYAVKTSPRFSAWAYSTNAHWLPNRRRNGIRADRRTPGGGHPAPAATFGRKLDDPGCREFQCRERMVSGDNGGRLVSPPRKKVGLGIGRFSGDFLAQGGVPCTGNISSDCRMRNAGFVRMSSSG